MKGLYICLAVAAATIMWACGNSSPNSSDKTARPTVKNVIINADTDNEVDDLIAIMGAMKADEAGELDIIGLTAVQWDGRNDTLPEGKPSGWNSRSAYTSWLMNNIMAQMLGRPDLPLLKGSDKKIVYKKGSNDNEGRPCEAADFIIAKAKELPDGEKLTIISTGALTNVAAALMQDSTIADRIAVYWLGQTYDAENENRWIGEYEFNVSNDLDAFDLLCDTEDLEFHIMPTNVSYVLWFKTAHSIDQLETLGSAGKFTADRWLQWMGGDKSSGRIIWDLAMIYAITNPELATQTKVMTPDWCTQREIDLYTSIDAPKMRAKFWESMGCPDEQ